MKEELTYEEKRLIKLLGWVAEWEIEEEILNKIAENGYMAAVKFVYTYVEDGAYCEAIVSHYCI